MNHNGNTTRGKNVVYMNTFYPGIQGPTDPIRPLFTNLSEANYNWKKLNGNFKTKAYHSEQIYDIFYDTINMYLHVCYSAYVR